MCRTWGLEYTYLLTPWSRVLLEKLIGSAASQEIPRLFGTRRFLIEPTSTRHLSLSWANSIRSPQLPPTSWRSILLLSSHLRLGLPNGLFPSGFPTRTLCTPLPSPIRATCPVHLILLDFTTRTILGKEYRSLSFSLCNFLHSPVTSSLLGPNTLLSTLSLEYTTGINGRYEFWENYVISQNDYYKICSFGPLKVTRDWKCVTLTDRKFFFIYSETCELESKGPTCFPTAGRFRFIQIFEVWTHGTVCYDNIIIYRNCVSTRRQWFLHCTQKANNSNIHKEKQ